MNNNKQWFRVSHWGRFSDVKVEAIDVIRETDKTIFFNVKWGNEVFRETRASKESQEQTFVQGKKAAFDLAISIADGHVRAAESLKRSALANIKKLQAQEKEKRSTK